MTPFDWKTYEASVKAGYPLKVVTRDEREVTQLVRFVIPSGAFLRYVVADEIKSSYGNGAVSVIGVPHLDDLMFAPKTRTVWVALVRHINGNEHGLVASSEQQLKVYTLKWLSSDWHVVDQFTREVPA